ncbi:MAG: hypothetical protein EON57_17125, partial [Alphaproteobacteria bacterium]
MSAIVVFVSLASPLSPRLTKRRQTASRIPRSSAKLRYERAKLLGYANHAELRMQDTMAKTPANAMTL